MCVVATYDLSLQLLDFGMLLRATIVVVIGHDKGAPRRSQAVALSINVAVVFLDRGSYSAE